MTAQRYVAVVGPAESDGEAYRYSREVGVLLAKQEVVLVCGGLGGAMEAACAGARENGGTTIGILPGTERSAANKFVDYAIATGLGDARNALVVGTADGVIAVSGKFGTLSEIGLALAMGKPVVGLDTWRLAKGGVEEGLVHVANSKEAVETILELIGGD